MSLVELWGELPNCVGCESVLALLAKLSVRPPLARRGGTFAEPAPLTRSCPPASSRRPAATSTRCEVYRATPAQSQDQCLELRCLKSETEVDTGVKLKRSERS